MEILRIWHEGINMDKFCVYEARKLELEVREQLSTESDMLLDVDIEWKHGKTYI
jgi:hypothetical protein